MENRRAGHLNRRTARPGIVGWLLFGLFIFSSCNTPQPPDPAELALQTVTAEYLAAEATAAALPPEPTPTEVPLKSEMTFVTSQVGETLLGRLRDIFNGPDFPLHLHESGELSGTALPSDAEIVFFAIEPLNLADLAAANPETSFVLLGKPSVSAANIYSIRYDPRFETFLAGYAVALAARDWRGGALLPADDPLLGDSSAEIFRNGMRYFCGPCKAIAAPYTVYPLTLSLPRASSSADWIAKLNELSSGPIQTVFVSEAAMSPELLDAASGLGYSVLTIGEKPENWDGNWIGGIRINLDKTLTVALGEIAAGHAPNVIYPPFDIITGNQGGTFFEGKKNLMMTLYENMAAGMILTTDPVPQAGYAK